MTPEEIQELRSKHYNATLVWMKEINPELRIFRVKPDSHVAEHKPGQYCTLGMGNWESRHPGCQDENLPEQKKTAMVRRAYSISSSILDDTKNLYTSIHHEWLEFYVVLVRDSGTDIAPALTPRLFNLSVGDRIFMGEKIAGHYTTDCVKQGDTVLFLSTGTGEAPHNYMAWDLLQKGHQGKIVSACCVRYQRDLGYLDTQHELTSRYENYHYLPLTTRENPENKKVYIQDLLSSGSLEETIQQELDPASTHVYLCGNPKMIGVPTVDRKTGEKTYPETRGVIEILEERGFAIDQPFAKIVGNIHFEEYW